MDEDDIPKLKPLDDDEHPDHGPPDADPPRAKGAYRGRTREDRTFAVLAHISGLIASFVGPLVIWMLKREESAYVDDQGCEALNFQITILAVILLLLSVTGITCGFGVIITGPLVIALSLANVVFSIIAAVKANEGEPYRYPLNARIVRRYGEPADEGDDDL